MGAGAGAGTSSQVKTWWSVENVITRSMGLITVRSVTLEDT